MSDLSVPCDEMWTRIVHAIGERVPSHREFQFRIDTIDRIHKHFTSRGINMATTDEVFDEALEQQLRQIADGVQPAAPAPEIVQAPAITGPMFQLKDGEQWFSALFWPPTLVPDFPVREFKRNDWPDTVSPRIPDLPSFWTWPTAETEQFGFAMYMGDRTLLYGPTGTGKSALPKAWCAKLNIPYILTSCHAQQEATDLLGKDNIKFNEETQALSLHAELSALAVGVRDGGMLVIDEAFRSPILMAIQSLLEPGGSLALPDAAGLSIEERKLTPPEGRSWIVLTDNTNGQGSEDGRYTADVQDLSTLDRITSTIFVDYPSAELEEKIMEQAAPMLKAEHRKSLLSIIALVRAAFKRGQIQQPISLRAAILLATKSQYLGAVKAFKQAYTAKLSTQDMTIFKEIWHQACAQDFPS